MTNHTRAFVRASMTGVIVAAFLLGCTDKTDRGDDRSIDTTIVSGSQDAPATRVTGSTLAGTHWQLVKFQSMDDAIGEIVPDDPTLYTMHLMDDSTVAMRLNCNRATGSWSIEPAANDTSGGFEFGPLGVTRAMCPPPSMDERIARDAAYVRSFLLKDGRLYLSLLADGGIYEWAVDSTVTGE